MKLNNNQKIALAMWLGSRVPNLQMDSSVITQFEEFCNEEMPCGEWRVISCFGMAGKIWNKDKIYLTGHSHSELCKEAYKEEQEIIKEWNEQIEFYLSLYA